MSALLPIANDLQATWIGWSGIAKPKSDISAQGFTALKKSELPAEVSKLNLVEVFLSSETIENYYLGFANSVLWPLSHARVDLVAEVTSEQVSVWWAAYVRANQKFAESIAAVAGKNAVVWVHDYHLQLVPGILKNLRPDLRIGFFLHIPAITEAGVAWLQEHEIAAEILRGLGSVDVLGVQSARDQTDIKNSLGLEAEVFPISIDPAPFIEPNSMAEATLNGGRGAAKKHEISNKSAKVLVGVDRIDYSKGIIERMQAFAAYLQETDEQLVLVQVLIPTRTGVPVYAHLRKEIEDLTETINAHFGRPGYAPVQNIFNSFSQRELINFYRTADVMIVSSVRDGMNLVAKEFVASRIDSQGVLLLSEQAGASDELEMNGEGAIVFDPLDPADFLQKLRRALKLNTGEATERMERLRKQVLANTAEVWARNYLKQL